MVASLWPLLPMILLMFLMCIGEVHNAAVQDKIPGTPQPVSPSPVPSPPPNNEKIPTSQNCSSGLSAVTKLALDIKPLPGTLGEGVNRDGVQKGGSYMSVSSNCTVEDPNKKGTGVSVIVPVESHAWKTRIIIACTVAAAIEVLIVIVMVMYWKQIRWTLRKFSCPCDERPTRRGHHAMEPTDSESPARMQQRPLPEGHAIQTFSVTASPLDDVSDEIEIIQETSSV